MPKPRSTDAKLERLQLLRDQNPSPEIRIELQNALLDASNHVSRGTAAAPITARLRFSELIPNLAAAFDPLMVDPLKSDKTCAGKTAIVDALNELDCQDPDLFLIGIRHVQLEPAWGGRNDTAAPLRAACVLGLVRMGYSKALPVLVDVLADSERVVRLAAAQALAVSGSHAALLLLRLKARLGDHVDPDVIGECLVGLMRAETCKNRGSLVCLRVSAKRRFQHCRSCPVGFRKFAAPRSVHCLEGIANGMRFDRQPTCKGLSCWQWPCCALPAATDFLFALVTDARESTASQALSALAILSYDARVQERAAAAVKTRDTKSLQDLFAEKFRALP